MVRKVSEGCYELSNIKIDTPYTITHNKDEEPFIMENKTL